MKKINLILSIATVAIFASCGNKTEENQAADSPAATEAASESTPAAESATPAPADAQPSTTVDVNKDGASVSTEKAKVDVSKDGAKVEIER